MKAAPCPICGKPGAGAYRPFCSRRCADVDLQRWLTARYRLSEDPAEGEDDSRPSVADED